MTDSKIFDKGGRGVPSAGLVSTDQPRRSYSPPRVLSVEQLEAAAATCDPATGTGGFGKTVPIPCGTLGS